MNDLIALSFFVGCLLATLGLVRLCEWLLPHAARPNDATNREARTSVGERPQ